MKAAAILTIKDAGDMTKKGRRDIANWIKKQANDLEILGDQYSSTLRARYFFEERKESE